MTKAITMTTAEILSTSWEELVGSKGIQTCFICDVPVQESITGMQRFNGETVCSDCYFGQEAERILREHPIESP